jgi:serine/threonine-protein kinase
MANPSGVNELVLRWQELREQGQPASAEELCAGCPELLDDLRRQIEALVSMENFLSATDVAAPRLASTPTPQSEALPDGVGPAAPAGGSAPLVGARYRPLTLHAQGGLGEIFLARDEELSREVALKRMRRPHAGDAESRRRFLREGEITGGLEHPGIVPVYGLTRDADGQPCYAMRFIRGQNLAEAIARLHATAAAGRDLALRQLLARFVVVCNTVAYAHSRGVVHRDLKPANIMLGDYGETLVVDWGLAKRVGAAGAAPPPGPDGLPRSPLDGQDGTGTGELLGTPAFMSPEQAAGQNEAVGPASDIYGLGATLYAVLTGRPPFGGDSVAEVLQRVQGGDFPPPRQLRPGTPRALEAICLKAMAREPSARYTTALELAADLERWLADEPVTAWREPLRVRSGRWVRRHQALVSAAAAAGLALLAGVAVSTALAVRAVQAEGEAKTKERQAVAAQQTAEERFELAKDSVDQYLNAITDDPELKDRHDLNRLRKKLLETAVPFYQKLARQKPGDAKHEAARGRAYGRLAVVRAAMGEREAARADIEQTRAIFARLAADFPNVPEYRQILAASHHELGILMQDLGELPAARAAHEQALKIREKLAADFPTVPAYRRALALSHNNLGWLLAELGERPAARAAYQRALKIRKKLAADFPTVPAYREEVAHSLLDVGGLLASLGERPAARTAFEQARKIYDKLAADFPTVPFYRQQLATSHNNLGIMLLDLGERPAARAAYEQALKIQGKLVADFPTVVTYRQELARSHNNQGNLLAALGERLAARATLEQALKIYQKLASDFPTVPIYRVELGASFGNYGDLLRDEGKPAAALEWYAKGQAALEGVLRQVGRHATARMFLRNVHWGRARALDELGRPAEATRDWDRALELDDGSDPIGFRMGKALSLARAGDHARAVAVAEALTAGKDVASRTLYDAACVCALSVAAKADSKLSDRYAARAVALLRRAQAAGLFKDPAHLQNMRKDPDLKPLHRRADYQRFLATLPAAAKNPAPAERRP